MNYDLSSVTKFGDMVKDALSKKTFAMINKYKESSRNSAFDKKVTGNEPDK